MSRSHSEFLSKYTLHKQTSGVGFQQSWTNVPAVKRAVPAERRRQQPQQRQADPASLQGLAHPGHSTRAAWGRARQEASVQGFVWCYRLSTIENTHTGKWQPSGRHGNMQVRGVFLLVFIPYFALVVVYVMNQNFKLSKVFSAVHAQMCKKDCQLLLGEGSEAVLPKICTQFPRLIKYTVMTDSRYFCMYISMLSVLFYL